MFSLSFLSQLRPSNVFQMLVSSYVFAMARGEKSAPSLPMASPGVGRRGSQRRVARPCHIHWSARSVVRTPGSIVYCLDSRGVRELEIDETQGHDLRSRITNRLQHHHSHHLHQCPVHSRAALTRGDFCDRLCHARLSLEGGLTRHGPGTASAPFLTQPRLRRGPGRAPA